MTSTASPFCSANWKTFGSSAGTGVLRLAATTSAAKHALENAIKPAAAVLADCRGVLRLRRGGMIGRRAARHLLTGGLGSLQALCFRVGVQWRSLVWVRRAEQQIVGEAVVGR